MPVNFYSARVRSPVNWLLLTTVFVMAVNRIDASEWNSDVSTVRRPLGPDEIPDQLSGRWKVSLCYAKRGHTWIRYENLESGEVRSISRFHLFVGGWSDFKHLRWHYSPTRQSGLYMDREQSLEVKKASKYILLSTVVDDPVIFQGGGTHGHGMIVNNCVTYTRDAWNFYTGEWYDLPPVHAPSDLLHSVLVKHPDVYRPAQNELKR